jgi:chaperone required for assembly of F1-ATPase
MTDPRPMRPPRQPQPLRKRVYKTVTVGKSAPGDGGDGAPHRVLLDGKALRTPAGTPLAVPTRALAEAIAGEWHAQGEHVDPQTMPLTKLANSAIDGVRGREAEIGADVLKFVASDLLCYRAEEPAALVERQSRAWDPILQWSREVLGADLAVAKGVMPVRQGEDAGLAAARAMARYGAFELAALHVMTALMGSAVLALALAHGRLDAEAAWSAAHVDEDWQISRWGADAEAMARRERRWIEMQAASRLLELLRRD